MAWDRQCVIEDNKSNMDMDNTDNPISPPEVSIEGVGGRNITDRDFFLPKTSHQRPESRASSAGDVYSNEQTDPGARKAPWLQLFQLVERQCQEQIDAQQEQFNHQLELIREEIKRLAQLQGSDSLWNCGTGNVILTQASAQPPSAVTGQHSQDEEPGESSNTAFHLFRELDLHKRAFITQEHFQENTSISSGYGTLSASEPNACLSSCSQSTLKKAGPPTKLTSEYTPVDTKKPFMLVPDTKCLEKSSEGNLSGNHMNDDKRADSQTNKPNSKSLTTWAQKLRKTNQKRTVQIEQSPSTQSNPHSEKDSDNTDVTSNVFLLNNRADSANSLISSGSGFTYWMLDEKDFYHPLPDNPGVSKLLHTKEPDETRIPSLTDIYYQKQREYGQRPAWEPIPPSEHTHPPEGNKGGHLACSQAKRHAASECLKKHSTPVAIRDEGGMVRYDPSHIATCFEAVPRPLWSIRQSLREKHARHLADLRDYYESEISNLKQQLVASSNSTTTTSKDLMKIGSLTERCSHMEGALSEASKLIRMLENKNKELEKQVTGKKGNSVLYFVFQLLLEYESLGKEHERVKDTLGVTENKLCDAQTEVNDLKRTVLKLETQIRQLEHENMMKRRHIAEGQSWSTSQKYHSPPEKEALHNYMAAKPKTEDSGTQESPILKALRDFEEEKRLEGWNKESSLYRLSSKQQAVGFSDCCTPLASPVKSRERQKHIHSPAGPRSSSLPPSSRKTSTVTTPTKRELMLTPLEVKYSPKRSPSENLSPGLSQLLCDEKNTVTRFDVAWAESSKCKDTSPRKRLQFTSLENLEERQKTVINPESSRESQFPLVMPPYETEITYNERMKNIADTERLFDELTEEKKQIEAALSRMPSVGRRISLQTRAMKENLEDRLEKINRDLGSIRMTLKRYHILPTSANI
ncbi:M-phase phosphoprotein 9 [Pyxicephalus adspersus]|uniref:M-phase phosphoprotein 9 n=1 Tax=Pyxicephalus adspersus TaxID=30357 RepID=UPI003B59E904